MRYADLSDDWDTRYEQLENVAKDLRTYGHLEETEFGEMVLALVNLWDCQLTEKLEEALQEAMCDALEYFKANFKIVEETQTITKTYKTLEEI